MGIADAEHFPIFFEIPPKELTISCFFTCFRKIPTQAFDRPELRYYAFQGGNDGASARGTDFDDRTDPLARD
jgi:hypothetical protein